MRISGALRLILLAWALLPQTAYPRASTSFLNQPAPELQVERWLTAVPDTAGKFVLLEFWATWCPSCRKSIPHLNSLQRKYSDSLAVVGLSRENEEAVRGVPDPQPAYFSAIDSEGRTAAKIGVTAIPHLLVIDPGGIVRWEGHPLDLTEAKLLPLLRQARQSKPAEKAAVAPASGAPMAYAPPREPPGPRKRLRFTLKDGRRVEGEWVGSFGNCTTIMTADRKQVDIRAADVVAREELSAPVGKR